MNKKDGIIRYQNNVAIHDMVYRERKSTPLEWLNHYKEKLQNSGQTIRPIGFDIIKTALKEKEKQDEVLKIIKEKKVDIAYVIECVGYGTYQYLYNRGLKYLLTKEEFDLLKEYFK